MIEILLPSASLTVIIFMTFLFLLCFKKKNKDEVEPFGEDGCTAEEIYGPSIHPVHVLHMEPNNDVTNERNMTSSVMSYASSSLEEPPPSWSAYRPKAGVAWAPKRSNSMKENRHSRMNNIQDSFASLFGSVVNLARSSGSRLTSNRTNVKTMSSRNRSSSWSSPFGSNRVSPQSIADAHRVHSNTTLQRPRSAVHSSPHSDISVDLPDFLGPELRPGSNVSKQSATGSDNSRSDSGISNSYRPNSGNCRPNSGTSRSDSRPKFPPIQNTSPGSENLELSVESLIQTYQHSPRRIRASNRPFRDKTNDSIEISPADKPQESKCLRTSTPEKSHSFISENSNSFVNENANSFVNHTFEDDITDHWEDMPVNEEAAAIIDDIFTDDAAWLEYDTPPMTPTDNPPGVYLPYKCALDLESIQSGSVSDISEVGHQPFKRWHSHHGYPHHSRPTQVTRAAVHQNAISTVHKTNNAGQNYPNDDRMTVQQHSPTKPSTPLARRSFRRSRGRASLSRESLVVGMETDEAEPNPGPVNLQENVTEMLDLQSFLDSNDLSAILLNRGDLRTGRLVFKASNYSVCTGIIRKNCVQYPSYTRSVTIQIHRGLNSEQDRINYLKNVVALRKLQHRNVLDILGVCVEGSQVTRDGIEFLMATGRVHFHVTLDRLLTWARDNNPELLTPRCAIKFALQICRGCQYLEKTKICHDNLMASTIMLDSKCVIKLSGIEVHQITTRPRNDRWLPLETLSDNTFNAKSVVWSYGVVLWELASSGQMPYPHLASTEEVHLYLAKGKRLICPENCPRQLHQIMYECWHEKGRDRLSFEQLYAQLCRYKLTLPASKPPEKLFPDKDDFMEDEYI